MFKRGKSERESRILNSDHACVCVCVFLYKENPDYRRLNVELWVNDAQKDGSTTTLIYFVLFWAMESIV